MTDEEHPVMGMADAIADAIAARLAESLYKMPDELRSAIKNCGAGFYGSTQITPNGENGAYVMRIMTRTSGIQMHIISPFGDLLWQAELL